MIVIHAIKDQEIRLRTAVKDGILSPDAATQSLLDVELKAHILQTCKSITEVEARTDSEEEVKGKLAAEFERRRAQSVEVNNK